MLMLIAAAVIGANGLCAREIIAYRRESADLATRKEAQRLAAEQATLRRIRIMSARPERLAPIRRF